MSDSNKVSNSTIIGVAGGGMSWHSTQAILKTFRESNAVISDPKESIYFGIKPGLTPKFITFK